MTPIWTLPRTPLAVVFDLDGTLVDSEALVGEGYFAAAAQFGLPFSHSDFLELVGKHRGANDATLLALWGDDVPLERFYATVSAHIGDRTAPLKPGALELMDHLDGAGLSFALATSSGPDWVRRIFSAHTLDRRFQAVVTREDVIHRKPHPEPYLKATAALGFDPGHVLAIEDSPTGVASASAAGLMTIMVPDLIQPDDTTRARTLHVADSLHTVLDMMRLNQGKIAAASAP